MLRFNDGMELDTSGKLRVVHKSDGLYVLGDGMSIPVNSAEEGRKIIEEFASRKTSDLGTFPVGNYEPENED